MRAVFHFITTTSLRLRWLVLALSLAVLYLGSQSWSRMNQELLPPIEFPSSFVFAVAGGMNSNQVMNLYTLPLENEFAAIDEIVNIESTTSPGLLLLNLANDFGVDRVELTNRIEAGIDSIWLPVRQLQPPAGEAAGEYGRRLLSELDGETLSYLAATDPAMILDLEPASWDAFSDEALAAALPAIAALTTSVEASATPLERFGAQQIIPRLRDLEEVADATFSGGETIARLLGETSEAVAETGAESSLLTQIEEDAWQVIARKAGISAALDQSLAQTLAAEAQPPPASAPALSSSWQSDEESRFQNADDLLEVVGIDNSVGVILNELVSEGRLRGPLGMTDDLNGEIITRMLAIDPNFAAAFDEEHLLAMPGDAFNALPQEIREPDDARVRRQFALKVLAESLAGRPGNPPPVPLPTAWQVNPPIILNFSFDDFPIAIYSVSGTVEVAGEDSAAASDPATPAPAPSPISESGEEGPELPPIFPAISVALGLELDTADDLLHIAFPPVYAEAFGVASMNAAEFLNFAALLAGADPTSMTQDGEDAPPIDLAAIFAATFACTTANQLSPAEQAGLMTAGTGVLVMCIDEPTLSWLADNDPTFLSALTPQFYALLPASILSLELPGFAPPLGGSSWQTLVADYQAGPVTTDALSLFGDSPAAALNAIAARAEDPEFSDVAITLLDELTPIALRSIALRDADFLPSLSETVWLSLSRESLSMLLAGEFPVSLSEETQAAAQQIIAGEPTALEQWRAANQDAEAAIEEGPALNEEWGPIADFYGIELDTADDFIRFQDVIGTPATFMNSFFASPRGRSVAPGLFGGISAEALTYLNAADGTFLNDLAPNTLRLMAPAVLAELESLSPGITERSLQVQVEPRANITRANSQLTLLLSVLKTSEANSVRSFHAMEETLADIQAEYPELEIAVIFEQSSFIEESITGVAREGALGAVFTIVIILLFLSDGRWPRRPRRIVGYVMFVLFAAGMALLIASNWDAANGDIGAAFDASDVIMRVLLIAGLLASLVVILLPGNLPLPAWRSTLVTTISIPLSLMAALAMLHYLPGFVHQLLGPVADNSIIRFILKLFPQDVTLNIMVLSGLTVAIGRVVDDSIVVLENIFRQMQLGKTDKRDAILTGTRDVSSAIFTATIVAVVVFLPLGLTGGLISEFFLPFGIAVTYALLASFIVAIMVVPVLASLFIRQEDIIGEEAGPIAGGVMKVYLPFLRWGLARWRNVGLVIGGALISMFIGFTLFGMRPFAFLPSLGEPQISLSVQLPPETTIIETNERVEDLEEFIRLTDSWQDDEPGETSEVRDFLSEVGSATSSVNFGTSGVSQNSANLTLTMSSVDAQERWVDLLREEAPVIFASSTGDAAASDAIDRCDPAFAESGAILPASSAPGTTIIVSAAAANSALSGFEMIMSGNTEALEILNDCVIQTLVGIEGLVNVSSNIAAGGEVSADLATIIRIDGRSALQFSGQLETENSIGVTQEAITTVEELPLLLAFNAQLPADQHINVSQGFASETQTEGFVGVGRAMVMALILVIAILIFTFGSPVYWLVIIFSVIVAPVGAAVALTVTNRVLGISALIGLLMLIGIVIANAVVLIDRVQTNRRERRMDTREALLEAGERRLRPILMTSLATIIALLPLAVGLSEGAIIASEMGTVVIGGVLGSTILTLVVVPVAYMLFNPAHEFFTRRFRIRRNQKS